ncbi:MAG: GH92 family glycosyl hydrolase [Bacteroidetes bacterium]|nr:GH92 family glycosyl hydrolase [Bacteroidota bacterium]
MIHAIRRIALLSCWLLALIGVNAQTTDYTRYADPMIGTGGHGHTFPGACVPFGMVQLSPDTRLKGWDGCSGYHYSDSVVYGFSHTHLDGTGCSDYGDILLMPTTGAPDMRPKAYRSGFSHLHEKAAPGYYSVKLDKYNILAELTATERTGFHKYTFTDTAGNIILDLKHRDKVRHAELHISADGEISGMRLSSSWADSQYVFFVMRFSQPFSAYGVTKGGIKHKDVKDISGHALRAWFRLATRKGEPVYVKVGLSPTSIDGARRNLAAEQPGWDFEEVKEQARTTWNKELGKIEITSSDTAVLRTFYTAMYHSFISPNLFSDVDGRYRGRDLQVHEGEGGNYYTVFSLWDTYRALHPLYNLIQRPRNTDMVHTMVTMYRQRGLLPIWELAGCETFCMTGYHAVPVIADAAMKGISLTDANTAYEAMRHSAMMSHRDMHQYFKWRTPLMLISHLRYVAGWDSYRKYGYIRGAALLGGTAKSLEHAYDDWCVGQMAKKLGKTDDYNMFMQRAGNYRLLLDSTSGFMRPRRKHFIKHFDPYKTSVYYTEGNAWQYAFSVPQDMTGHIRLIGGRARYCTMLDSLFHTTSNMYGLPHPDVAGMIGQYAHGNEPSHMIAYAYDYAAQPWKTQQTTRLIMDSLYTDKPDGLCGNDDCGQMSAWYVFSAMGFYPVCPGSNHYAIGSPKSEKTVLHLDDGKTFTITAADNSKANVYIQSALLNGATYTKSYLSYEDVMNGGTLDLKMGPVPNIQWGSADADVPVTRIETATHD